MRIRINQSDPNLLVNRDDDPSSGWSRTRRSSPFLSFLKDSFAENCTFPWYLNGEVLEASTFSTHAKSPRSLKAVSSSSNAPQAHYKIEDC